MNTVDKIYEIVDGFLVEAKDQYGNERSLKRLNEDRHLAVDRILEVVSQAKLEEREKVISAIASKYELMDDEISDLKSNLEEKE